MLDISAQGKRLMMDIFGIDKPVNLVNDDGAIKKEFDVYNFIKSDIVCYF